MVERFRSVRKLFLTTKRTKDTKSSDYFFIVGCLNFVIFETFVVNIVFSFGCGCAETFVVRIDFSSLDRVPIQPDR